MLSKIAHSILAPSFIGAGGVAILGMMPDVHDVANLSQICVVLFTTILQLISVFKKKPPVIVVEPTPAPPKRRIKRRSSVKKIIS